jgi:chemotaxis protein methyltransferase CheR
MTRLEGSPARGTSTIAPARGVAADEYEQFCVVFRRVCGIDLSQYKRGQMERRIRSFVATRAGDADLLTYANALKADKAELDKFLDRVTINVSQLWRNPDQWEVLEEKILPDLAKTAPTPNRVRCWSAGSSYGAEAYTLAAVARRAIPRAGVSILGTDIDARMVERARAGVFTAEDARDAPTATLASHFAMVDGQWHASDELKRIVRFEQGDLLRVDPAADSFDLVLCRNTVIYFNEDVRDALHGRLAASLRTGGRLVVGATERVSDPVKHALEPESPFVYRKI